MCPKCFLIGLTFPPPTTHMVVAEVGFSLISPKLVGTILNIYHAFYDNKIALRYFQILFINTHICDLEALSAAPC